jgi:hypothetical protein
MRLAAPLPRRAKDCTTANSSFVYGYASFDCGAKSAPPLRMLPYVNVETALLKKDVERLYLPVNVFTRPSSIIRRRP